MNTVHVIGTGAYLPRRMLDNADLPALDRPPTPEELAKIGVHRRGWAGDGESIPEMAAAASRQALARAGVDPAELDFIVLANWTQRRLLPDFAPKVQALLGAHRAFAFDVATACAGFAFAVEIARSFLQNPRYKRGLVVASETTSWRARPHSKATLVFGDAAGAWVVERDAGRGHQLVDVELGTDGRYFDAMEMNAEGHTVTHIPQKELQALATRSFQEATAAVLGRHGLTLDDVDYVVPHSGTAGIQALLLRVLDLPPERVLTNFPSIGNVSSAAIPTALEAYLADGTLKPGHLILSPTTGSGWYAAALLYRIGAQRSAA